MRFFNWFRRQAAAPVVIPPAPIASFASIAAAALVEPPPAPIASFAPIAAAAPVELPPPQMARVAPFEPGELPLDDVSRFVEDVNGLINQYNSVTDDSPRKISTLQQIQEKIKQFDHLYRPSTIAASPGYRATHAALFRDIKAELATLGRSSLLKPDEPSSPLAEVIANMAPDKADSLLAILVKGGKLTSVAELAASLGALYRSDNYSEEADRFRDFLQNHQISYLGGGNSKNYKVINIHDSSESVLKVDCRLNMPINVEDHLRQALAPSFAPIAAERLVTCNDAQHQPITRTLLVTDYCAGGSLIDERVRLTNVDKIVDTACDRFAQMARVMLGIQEAGCIFPDAKATNWLVDGKGELRLADTKSFLFTDSSGNYHKKLPANKHALGFIQTGGFIPPEFIFGRQINADHVHAFLLGKNIHYYLTNLDQDDKTDRIYFDFSHLVFKTEKGAELQTLIQALVRRSPANRISVQNAANQLENPLFIIKNPDYNQALKDLEALKFAPNDELMNTFIREKKQQIAEAPYAQKTQILVDLKGKICNLQNDTAVKEIKDIVGNYRENAGLFTIGMKAKSLRIETAMLDVPVEDRVNFLQSPGSSKVMEALASHRYLGKRGNVYLNENGQVDTEKAATTFKEFKKKNAAQMTDSTTRNEPSLEPDKPNPQPS